MVGVGQSYGGQALGLCGISGRFTRYGMVATMSGYHRGLDDRWAGPRMFLIGVPVASLLGRVPRWLGIGEPIPASVFRDWARWCRRPDYFFGDPVVPETAALRRGDDADPGARAHRRPLGNARAPRGRCSSTMPTRRSRSAGCRPPTAARRSAISASSGRGFRQRCGRSSSAGCWRGRPMTIGETTFDLAQRMLPSAPPVRRSRCGSSAGTWSPVPRPRSDAAPWCGRNRPW